MEEIRFALQYINMCREAQEELEYIRTFNATEIKPNKMTKMGEFSFKIGDYFHHSKMKDDEEQVLEKIASPNLQDKNDPYPYRVEECAWIPTADQLIDEVGEISFSIMNKEDLKKYYAGHYLSDPNISDEERVLSYFIEHRHKKAWDFEKQKWSDFET